MLYYKTINTEEDVFQKAYDLGLALLLKGPTGCGKSRFVEHMAEKLQRPLVTVVCNDETSSHDLLGRFLIKGQETVWIDGPVTRALRQGSLLYLDEIVEARSDITSILHALGDYRRTLYIDKTNESLKAPKEFMLVASFNPGYQQGLKELKPSLRQRFLTIEFDYPVAEVEQDILVHETGIDNKTAGILVKMANKIRKMEDLQLAETVSTRLLVSTAQLIKSGLSARTAVDAGIIQTITDDKQVVRSLWEVLSLYF